MKERFDKCIDKFLARKGHFEQTKVKSNQFFAKQEKINQLKILNDYLESLIKYEAQTSELKKTNPENKKFYKAHFEAVVKMLENLENKNAADFTDEDFTLKIPKSVPYHLTSEEIKRDVGLFAAVGAVIGAGIGALAGLGCYIAALIIIAPATLTLLDFTVVMGMVLGFMAVGAALGALVGSLIGYCIVPYKGRPLGENTYLDNKALDLTLLKKAYELCPAENTQNHDSANEENINSVWKELNFGS
ncbi:MAG: glycine zipper family protein [Tatlockia sp.]|nr:glycine zipper family protein [Tatlockia sp.]